MNGQDNDGNGYKNDIIGWNFVANTNNPFDDNSHGTHVSGTIAASSNNGVGVTGVDWNARILPVKILDSTGSGSTSAGISGINYAAKFGARVINASWGGAPYSSSMATAITGAGNLGSVFVAAAGNNTTNNDTTPFYPASYRTSNEIVVTAVVSWGVMATYSNYGATTVDVGAPGTSIYSTIPGGYAYKSGTSMAAPNVSGVVALLAGLDPQYSASQLVQQVVSNTKPLAALAGQTISGGLVDAYNVLNAPKLSTPTVPATPTSLAASAASSSSIQLSWTGSSGATSYKIQRSADGSTNWTQIGTISSTTAYTDSGLTAGTKFFYQVVASNGTGDSSPSNVSSATTNPASAPSAPTGLTASAAAFNKLNLSWTGSSGASSYKIDRSTDSTTWAQIGTVTTTSYADTSVASSTTYYYRARASNPGGDSTYSNTSSATTPKKGK